ncbi:MAG: hypothetical protein ABI175_03330, partial [Polyangiales bacterium]
MTRLLSHLAFPLAAVAVMFAAGTASAQDTAPKEDTSSDHSKVVGHVGIGYFGQFDVPLGSALGINEQPA